MIGRKAHSTCSAISTRRGNARRLHDAPDHHRTRRRLVADHDDVVSMRAEDASGSFGILPGHADLITVLTPSVVAWRHANGRLGWCAVRAACCRCTQASEVAIATRQAQLGDDLAALELAVLARFRAEPDAERQCAGRCNQTAHRGDPPDHPRAAS